MASINEYSIIKPPTSHDIEDETRRVLGKSNQLSLTILSVQEVPPPVPEDIILSIRGTSHPEVGGMVIRGYDASDPTISLTINMDLDPLKAAHATRVVPDPSIPDVMPPLIGFDGNRW